MTEQRHDQGQIKLDAPLIIQMEPLAVRVEQAADLLNLSRSTVYRLIDSGEIPATAYGMACDPNDPTCEACQ